jgi:hypothetical protein
MGGDRLGKAADEALGYGEREEALTAAGRLGRLAIEFARALPFDRVVGRERLDRRDQIEGPLPTNLAGAGGLPGDERHLAPGEIEQAGLVACDDDRAAPDSRALILQDPFDQRQGQRRRGKEPSAAPAEKHRRDLLAREWTAAQIFHQVAQRSPSRKLVVARAPDVAREREDLQAHGSLAAEAPKPRGPPLAECWDLRQGLCGLDQCGAAEESVLLGNGSPRIPAGRSPLQGGHEGRGVAR